MEEPTAFIGGRKPAFCALSWPRSLPGRREPRLRGRGDLVADDCKGVKEPAALRCRRVFLVHPVQSPAKGPSAVLQHGDRID